jgi:hypothetical protein
MTTRPDTKRPKKKNLMTVRYCSSSSRKREKKVQGLSKHHYTTNTPRNATYPARGRAETIKTKKIKIKTPDFRHEMRVKKMKKWSRKRVD